MLPQLPLPREVTPSMSLNDAMHLWKKRDDARAAEQRAVDRRKASAGAAPAPGGAPRPVIWSPVTPHGAAPEPGAARTVVGQEPRIVADAAQH